MTASNKDQVERLFIHLPRELKMVLTMGSDVVVMMFSLWCALALRLGEWNPDISEWPWIFVVAPLIGLAVFYLQGLYRTMLRYASPLAVYSIMKGVAVSALGLLVVVQLSLTPGVPRSLYFIYWLIAVGLLVGSRYAVRIYYDWAVSAYVPREPVAIYGAGDTGVHLANAMLGGREFQPVAFIDDNPALQGRVINGVGIYPKENLPELIEEYGIRKVMLALPSASAGQRRELLNYLLQMDVYVRSVPAMKDIVAGRARLDHIRDVDVEELLGRDVVNPCSSLLRQSIGDHAVMVTGAGGSIGSELCRQIHALQPRTLVLFEVSEPALYAIHREFEQLKPESVSRVRVVAILGDVKDEQFLAATMREYDINVVFHAAAYKHVPIVEQNIIAGVRNNVFGTLSAVRAAESAGVERFVLVSTDKAVRPTNVMGATKRCAELILQARSAMDCGVLYCMVRFGNVLGSSGSVVPLFRQQIQNGGPVTVTHPEVTRYFMTIPEAAQLVVQAGAMGAGGEVFVLDMGQPVRILDLARNMIRLMGHEVRDEVHPGGEIEIQFSGLRPGEKLYEELLISGNVSGTSHEMIMRAQEEGVEWDVLECAMECMDQACSSGDRDKIVETLTQLVQGYTPGSMVVPRNGKVSGIERNLSEERKLQ